MITIQVLATGQIQVNTKLPEVMVASICAQLVAQIIARQAAAMAGAEPRVKPANGRDLKLVKDN